MNDFPFSDLHSFKDYVAFVRMCAPDYFPLREGAGPQWSLDLAFDGLRYGLDLSERNGAKASVIAQCRPLLEQALGCYRANNRPEGFRVMQEMERLLKRLPSQ
jgi:hypothetical protein